MKVVSKEAELPTEIEKIDALELENLQLKVEKMQGLYNEAVLAFQAKFSEIGKRFDFDPKTATINYATRKITRP